MLLLVLCLFSFCGQRSSKKFLCRTDCFEHVLLILDLVVIYLFICFDWNLERTYMVSHYGVELPVVQFYIFLHSMIIL